MIVQDLLRPQVLDGMDAGWIQPEAVVNELAAFLGFAFVGTVSPGPNNTVLWASGMTFGFRRTIAHVVGTALGMGALVLGVAAGIGALLEAVPVAELLLKVIGSAYLLWVAFQVVAGGGIGRTEVSHPLSLWQGTVFQWVNPKAWVFTIAAVGTFLPPALPRPVGALLLTGTLMVVVVGSSSIWAAGGAALSRVVEHDRRRRVVSIALAILLVASVALIWV
jgi:threonine/homoserine/homoserine lactone efflux protein